jgi:superfamily II DNA or RNA helicase
MWMQTLRPYQLQAIDLLRVSIQRHKRSILCVPTGGGKTTIVASMIHSAMQRGKSILFLAHRKELLTQAIERLESFGLAPGLVQGNNTKPSLNLNVASVQTLRNRLNLICPPDIIFIDECHLAMANSYRIILDNYPNAFVVGMTATPSRLDGKPLGDIFKDIVNPISISHLTSLNFLCTVRKFASKEHIDLNNVRTTAGDFNSAELYSKFNKSTLYAGVVDNYIKFAKDRPFIVFCVNVQHSKNTAKAFQNANINCEHLDGETPQHIRDNTIARFRSGLIQGVCNVGLFTEGFDMPHISCVILNRATQSLALYLQMVGRGLRPAPNKKDLVVIDHGDNVLRHGWYDTEHEWSLTKKKKKTDKQNAFPVRLCESCEAMMPVSTAICPECGHQKEQKVITPVFAEFAELVKPKVPEHLRKRWRDMDIDELREFARFKGYKEGWVRAQLNLRK